MVPRQLGPSDWLWIEEEHLACGKVLQSKCLVVMGWPHTTKAFSCTCDWLVALSLENIWIEGSCFTLLSATLWSSDFVTFEFCCNGGAYLFFGSDPCLQNQLNLSLGVLPVFFSNSSSTCFPIPSVCNSFSAASSCLGAAASPSLYLSVI